MIDIDVFDQSQTNQTAQRLSEFPFAKLLRGAHIVCQEPSGKTYRLD